MNTNNFPDALEAAIELVPCGPACRDSVPPLGVSRVLHLPGCHKLALRAAIRAYGEQQRAEEREACADIADREAEKYERGLSSWGSPDTAAAIRERGTP